MFIAFSSLYLIGDPQDRLLSWVFLSFISVAGNRLPTDSPSLSKTSSILFSSLCQSSTYSVQSPSPILQLQYLCLYDKCSNTLERIPPTRLHHFTVTFLPLAPLLKLLTDPEIKVLILWECCCGWPVLLVLVPGWCVHAKSFQSCPSLCDPMDYSPPGSSVHGILQAKILEWVVMPSSRETSQPRNQIHISYISLYWQADSLPLVPPGAFLAARTVKNPPAIQETQGWSLDGEDPLEEEMEVSLLAVSWCLSHQSLLVSTTSHPSHPSCTLQPEDCFLDPSYLGSSSAWG